MLQEIHRDGTPCPSDDVSGWHTFQTGAQHTYVVSKPFSPESSPVFFLDWRVNPKKNSRKSTCASAIQREYTQLKDQDREYATPIYKEEKDHYYDFLSCSYPRERTFSHCHLYAAYNCTSIGLWNSLSCECLGIDYSTVYLLRIAIFLLSVGLLIFHLCILPP